MPERVKRAKKVIGVKRVYEKYSRSDRMKEQRRQIHSTDEAAAAIAADASVDAAKDEKRKKKFEERIERIQDYMLAAVDPDAKSSETYRSKMQLAKLAALPGARFLFQRALSALGDPPVLYAALVDMDIDVGMHPEDEDIGHRIALEARKSAKASIENLYELGKKEEVTPPQVFLIIGAPMQDAAEKLNKRYPMEAAQWSEADS